MPYFRPVKTKPRDVLRQKMQDKYGTYEPIVYYENTFHTAVHPELQECIGQGETPEEAVNDLADALKDLLDVLADVEATEE